MTVPTPDDLAPAPDPRTPVAGEPPATPPPGKPSDETQVARAVFAEGLAHSDAGRWSEAADCFRRVLAIRWSAAAAHNLGAALAELGRLVEASEQLRLVVRDAEADAEMRAAAQRTLAAIEPQIGKLTIRLVGGRDGVEVLLDGDVLPTAALDGAIRIDPGRHVVLGRWHGTYVAREDIFLGAGAPRAIVLSLDVSPALPEFAPLPATLPAPDAAQKHAASTPARVTTTPADEHGDDTAWWLWLGSGIAATTVIAVALVVGFGTETRAAHPVDGDLSPAVLRGRVVVP